MSARHFNPHGGQEYTDAETHLRGRAQLRLPGKATTLYRLDARQIAVRYHETDVVTYNGDNGIVAIRSGGWATMTTSSKIHTYCPRVQAWRQNNKLCVGAVRVEPDPLVAVAREAAVALGEMDASRLLDDQPAIVLERGVTGLLLPTGMLMYEHETIADAQARIRAWHSPARRRARGEIDERQLALVT